MKTSIIIPTHNEGKWLPWTLDRVFEGTEGDFEVVVVDDSSTDGSTDHVLHEYSPLGPIKVVRDDERRRLGVANAKNLGAGHATGEILAFLDAHSFPPPGWLPPLLECLEEGSIGLVGPGLSTLDEGNDAVGLGQIWKGPSLEIEWMAQAGEVAPYPVMIVPGGCQVIRHGVFDLLGGFDAGITRWGQEDQDLSVNCWLSGWDVLVHPGVVVRELFRTTFPYAVNHEDIIYNRLRMALINLEEEALLSVLGYHPSYTADLVFMLRLLLSDAAAEREHRLKRFCRTSSWLLDKFGVSLGN